MDLVGSKADRADRPVLFQQRRLRREGQGVSRLHGRSARGVPRLVAGLQRTAWPAGAVTHLTTDVLVIGAGGAGMYAAIAAAREGRSVLLLDKNLVGRGGATVM